MVKNISDKQIILIKNWLLDLGYQPYDAVIDNLDNLEAHLLLQKLYKLKVKQICKQMKKKIDINKYGKKIDNQ